MSFIIFLSCSTAKKFTGKADTLFSDEDYDSGLAIVRKGDCLTCHKTNEKFVGPAFRAIADRYENVSISVIEKLSNKIRSGSSGTWGTVPMPPRSWLNEEEAKTVIKYILLTKYK